MDVHKPVFPMLRAMNNFLQKNVITVKELLNILQAKSCNKYKHFQAQSDTFEAGWLFVHWTTIWVRSGE